MGQFTTALQKQSLLPLIQVMRKSDGVEVARAMRQAGLTIVEVVLRTPESFNALTEIKTTFPELRVGAGTILNVPMFDQAVAAGADFIVTPAITPKLLERMAESKVPCLPGVSKPSDIAAAYEAGLSDMKLFPAELSGGIGFLQAMAGVFQKVKFCPTGGIHPGNKNDYLALSNVIAVGGSWLVNPKWIQQQNWAAITEACESSMLVS